MQMILFYQCFGFFFLVRVSVFLILQVSFTTVLYFKLIDACWLSSERNFLYTRRERGIYVNSGSSRYNFFIMNLYIWNPPQKRSSKYNPVSKNMHALMSLDTYGVSLLHVFMSNLCRIILEVLHFRQQDL